MSGWNQRTYSVLVFELTYTKARYWHRRCGCGAATLDELWTRHLEPAGFELVPHQSASVLALAREDLRFESGPTFSRGPIFEALQPV